MPSIMRARSSSDKRPFRQKTTEKPRNLFFSGSDPLLRERLRLAAAAYPGLALSFDENQDSLPADIRVIPVHALNGEVSCKDPLTLAYGPIEYMAQAFLYGCADYLAEPWLPEELILRCWRLRDTFKISFPGCCISYTPFALISRHKVLPLSLQEFRLLRAFALNLNAPLARGELFRILGYVPGRNSPRLVDARVSVLRKKLSACRGGSPLDGPRLNPIRQVRGIGYGLWDSV